MGNLRDLKEGEQFKEPIEVLSVDQLQQRVNLAHYYMRKAGMSVKKPILEKKEGFFERLRWFITGILLATLYLLATNTFGR